MIMKSPLYMIFIVFPFLIGCPSPEAEEIYEPPITQTPDNDGESNDGDNADNDDGFMAPTDFYRFTSYQTTTADPYDVNVLFHVSDSLFRGVPNLILSDFRITENDEDIPVDESEGILHDRYSFELTMKTALLVDVSNSIQTDFDTLKQELKDLIETKPTYQEVAIFTFSTTTELVLDYTSDKEQLKTTIDNLQLGTSSTDFYGAVVTAANSFENEFINDQVTVGNLIIFTDGDDTQSSSSFTAAKEAIQNKNAYVVGLSSQDLDEDNIRNLVGNAFYYPSENLASVNSNFILIQEEIENFSNSIYLLNYESPKRGNNEHFLKIFHKNNVNSGLDSFAFGEFTSSGFYEPVAPTAAVLISPSINENITLENTCSVSFEIGRSIDGNLTASDEITYEFYFGDSETSLELIDYKTVSVSQEIITFESPSGLIPQSTYYWQIKTLDDDFDELDTQSEIAVFQYIESIYVGESLYIKNNDFSDTCYSRVSNSIYIGDVEGETINNSFQGFPYLTEIGSTLAFNNVATTDFFPNLIYINNSLGIGSFSTAPNESLTSITGLENLESVDHIKIEGNINLTEIIGFPKLSSLSALTIRKNSALERVDSFNQIIEMWALPLLFMVMYRYLRIQV